MNQSRKSKVCWTMAMMSFVIEGQCVIENWIFFSRGISVQTHTIRHVWGHVYLTTEAQFYFAPSGRAEYPAPISQLCLWLHLSPFFQVLIRQSIHASCVLLWTRVLLKNYVYLYSKSTQKFECAQIPSCQPLGTNRRQANSSSACQESLFLWNDSNVVWGTGG